MAAIKVVVHGASGKMGQEVLRALTREPDMVPVAAANRVAVETSIELPDGSGSVPFTNDLAGVISGTDVVVDFSTADGALSVMRTAAPRKVNVVVGTTGIPETGISEAATLADEHGVGIIIAPNFAVGAVLMIHLAEQAARFFDYADLTEMHHEGKIDAPSGTALAIARGGGCRQGRYVYGATGGEGAGRGHARRHRGRRVHTQRPGCPDAWPIMTWYSAGWDRPSPFDTTP